MNRIIRQKNNEYTTVSNVCVRDSRLSLKAKGFMMVIMSLPDDWNFSIAGLASIVKEGKAAIYSAIDELKECGYCSVTICRDEKGIITGNDYTFYENPQSTNPNTENPHTDFPHADNPDTENQPQINIDITKERKNKKESKKGSFVPDLSLVSDEFRPFVEEWLQYKTERGEKYKSQKGVIAFYNKLIELSNNNPETAKRIIEQSYANNWAGIFTLKQSYNNRYDQRIDDVQRRQDGAAAIIARLAAEENNDAQ